MNKIEFDIQKMPADYALCFIQQCPLHEQCMHYVVGQQASHIRPFGPAVYPWALHDGQCELYHHHGERKLTPQQQQDVIAIVMRYGSTKEPLFGHYEEAFDFS